MNEFVSFDDLTAEALDAADDRIAEINRQIAAARAGEQSPETALSEIRGLANSLKGVGQTYGISVLRVLSHRLEDYLAEVKDLSDAVLDDVQVFADRTAEALETHLKASADEIAQFVRRLPAKGSAGFEVSDVRVRDIEVMLVMEPSTATRFVTRELQECGYRMTNVWSTIDAFQLVPHIRPDLVIVSNVMRDLTGVDFCCAIKAMPSTKDTLVALLTSERRDNAAFKALPEGVPVLSKSSRFGDDVTRVFSDLGLL
ncbi:Hpt domain-containing protein [Rhodothalassium salexigens DSM 2132]|uniref:Hpt domain-containing protein n=1 Tax=Rhodothalassium salexigens DSM 2132 TaxID=1188247 RepID=A0A4R2PPJ2_RHOSA|nr:response regulator [Rhodothalassium salexigens]MBB4210752.1 CheY-like chemotaxis protein/HPt (histidine-containing phosphotransfer) domain-containing protein [Rhodothalassium salexigens DSM 2132]MBK1638267.1 hypothetical protein [Rhodothalassium salexigens DSM 2132]TCP37692.1 Hpt domain-containing protein [Rhodothalassium salexigens DSM 2132]